MIMRDTLVQNDGERMKEDMAYIMESLHNEAVYVPLTEVVSLAVYREGLSGPDMDSAGAAWGIGAMDASGAVEPCNGRRDGKRQSGV